MKNKNKLRLIVLFMCFFYTYALSEPIVNGMWVYLHHECSYDDDNNYSYATVTLLNFCDDGGFLIIENMLLKVGSSIFVDNSGFNLEYGGKWKKDKSNITVKYTYSADPRNEPVIPYLKKIIGIEFTGDIVIKENRLIFNDKTFFPAKELPGKLEGFEHLCGSEDEKLKALKERFKQIVIRKHFYDIKGKEISEDHFKKNGSTGTILSIYKSGKKKITRYKNGKIDGKLTVWYNGFKTFEHQYKNGKKDGRFTIWIGKDKKWEEVHYKNGKRHGKEIKWYFGTKQKMRERNFNEGRRHGKDIMWHRNGQIESITTYKEGKENGKETWWTKEGHKYSEINWMNGKPHGKFIKWDIEGNLVKEEIWVNGKLFKKIK